MGSSFGKWILAAALASCVVAAGWPRAAQAADDPFLNFISPITDPTNFEDPRSQSDLRPIYIYHVIPGSFAQGTGLDGGYVNVVAVQLRAAITDRWSIIATKDGYVWVRPTNDVSTATGGGVVTRDSGFANIAFGVKWNFWRDSDLGALASAGLRYEAPSGEPQALQGPVFKANALSDRGNGLMNPFVSYGWAIDDLHLLGYTGFRLPLSDVDSMFFDWSLHADYRLPEITFAGYGIGHPYPVVELNWKNVMRGGDRIPLAEEGFDFFNLGSSEAGGENIVTMGFGGRWRFTDDLELWGQRGGIDWGIAYELPVTSSEGLFDWRITTDLIFWLS
jgi:hypothetical protein